MQQIQCRLTVYFEDPFWVGLYERECGGALEVCKIVFGPEPSSPQVHEYLMENWHRLRFSPPLKAATRPVACRNPKRIQREITRSLTTRGTGTKSQQAIALGREQGQAERRAQSRGARETERQHRYELRREKRREKKKGH